MKKFLSTLVLSALFMSPAYSQQNSQQKHIHNDWMVAAFGQSTDLNFSSLVKPEKVGTNFVWQAGSSKPLNSQTKYPLFADFTIESRGGKIANSHDGMTVFYKQLPITSTFVLEADVILEQLGPEVDGKTPAAQESAGLFVRDVIGTPRQDPQSIGYEEFPNASNLLMNALVTQNRKNDNLVQVISLLRSGVIQPWGNDGIEIVKNTYVKNVSYANDRMMRLKIERTANQYLLSWQDKATGEQKTWTQDDYSNLMNAQEKGNLYVGFYAARNAKIRIIDASLRLTDGTVDYKKLVTAPVKPVKAQAPIEANSTTVQKSSITDLTKIYVATDGKSNSVGTKSNPVDLTTAIKAVAPNGIIYLADGYYDGVTIAPEFSGTKDKLKTLQAENLHKAIFINKTFNLDANYWHLNGLVFDGNIDGKENKPAYLRIAGSHNIVERAIARNNADTGVSITAGGKNNRSLWPSHNLILNTDSYNNQDKSGINADGFAAKLGVGAGNIFRGCIAHHNADDGWDLFNKIENGPNEVVIIENSIAYENGLPFDKQNIAKGSIGNGFKLGGEGQPVNHIIENSIAFNNNMDGFTDNFNTGSLVLKNNVAIDNARYNYILRDNPYSFLNPTIIFSNNQSLRHSWDKQTRDSFGKQVKIEDFITGITTISLPKTVERDSKGNIIYGNLPR